MRHARFAYYPRIPARIILFWLKFCQYIGLVGAVMNIGKEQIQLLHMFVDICKAKPDTLRLPELRFYRDWLER